MAQRNTAERRLLPEDLARILREEPTKTPIHDGGGLYLNNQSSTRGPNGLRTGYWYHAYEQTVDGRRKAFTVQIGPTDKIGAPSVPSRPPSTEKQIRGAMAATLFAARKHNDEIREMRRSGVDPRAQRLEERQQKKDASANPFCLAAVVDEFIATRPEDSRHTYQGYRNNDLLSASIGTMDIREITPQHGAAILINGQTLRGRRYLQSPKGDLLRWFLEKLWEHARRKFGRQLPELWQMENPFSRDQVKSLLPPQEERVVEHQPALPWQEVPAFMARLRAVPTRKARAAEVTILLAKRSKEVCGARYSQIDWQTETIEIRAGRNKGKRYLNPLAKRTMEILRECAREDGIDTTLRPTDQGYKDQPIFIGPAGKVKDTAGLCMAKFVRSVDPSNSTYFTQHGFRADFEPWAWHEYQISPETQRLTEAQSTDIINLCMGHKVAEAVRTAYLRPHSNLMEEARACLEKWAQFCCSVELSPGEVVLTSRREARAYHHALTYVPLVKEMIRLVDSGEVAHVHEAAEIEALKIAGPATLEAKTKELITRYGEATGYAGRNAGPVRRGFFARSFPPGHPANMGTILRREGLNIGSKASPTETCTTEEAAIVKGIHHNTIINRIRTGEIVASKGANGVYQIDKASLEQFQYKNLRYGPKRIKSKILALLKENSPAPVSLQQIWLHSEEKYKILCRSIWLMLNATPPQIVRVGRGMYTLPEQGQPLQRQPQRIANGQKAL